MEKMEAETRLVGCSIIFSVGNLQEGERVPKNSDIRRTRYNKTGIQNKMDVHHTRRIPATSNTPSTTRATYMGSNMQGQTMAKNKFLSMDSSTW